MKVGDDFIVSEFSEKFWSKFERVYMNKQPIADEGTPAHRRPAVVPEPTGQGKNQASNDFLHAIGLGRLKDGNERTPQSDNNNPDDKACSYSLPFVKVCDDHESQPKEELNVSELSDGYWSEF